MASLSQKIKDATANLQFMDRRGRKINNPSLKRRKEYLLTNFNKKGNYYKDSLAIIKSKNKIVGKLGPANKKLIKKGVIHPPVGYYVDYNSVVRKDTNAARARIRRRGRELQNNFEVKSNFIKSAQYTSDDFPVMPGIPGEMSREQYFNYLNKNMKVIIKDFPFVKTRNVLMHIIFRDESKEVLLKTLGLKGTELSKEIYSSLYISYNVNAVDSLFVTDKPILYIKMYDIVPVKAVYRKQIFREGLGNCVLNQIDSWAIGIKEKRFQNKLKIYHERYDNVGMTDEDIQEMCKDLQIDVVRTNILGEVQKHIKSHPERRPRKKIVMCNSQFNHLGKPIDLDLNAPPIILTDKEMADKLKTNKPVVWVGSHSKPRCIYMEDGRKYKTKDDEVITMFMKRNDKYRLEIPDKFIDYIHSANHFVTATPTKFGNTKPGPYLEWDGTTFYAQYHKDPYYNGLAMYSQYGKCNKILGEGVYTIKNIKVLWKPFKTFFNLVPGQYPSAFLRMLQDKGWATFDIVYGCYASPGTEIKENIFNKKEIDGRKYQELVGMMSTNNKHKVFWTKGNMMYAENLKYESGCNIDMIGDNNIRISVPKKSRTTMAHLSSGILGSCLNLLLLEFEKYYKWTYYVTIDSLLVTKDCPLGESDVFRIKRDKEGNIKYKDMGMEFQPELLSHYQFNYKKLPRINAPKIQKIMTIIGPGGSGKSTWCSKQGFLNHIYGTDTEFQTNSQTYAKPRNFQCMMFAVTKWIDRWRIPSLIILDEASKITKEEALKLIKLYPHTTIIFCGDLGYQLEPVNEGSEMIPMGFVKDDLVYVYRFKCEKLRMIANGLREGISKRSREVFDKYWNMIPKRNAKYTVNDFILTHTNKNVKLITDMYKKSGIQDKYLIKKNTRTTYNGQITLTKPNVEHEIRHAFTGHQIQGATIKDCKIFIHDEQKKGLHYMRWLYTVLSRAEYLDQIYLI